MTTTPEILMIRPLFGPELNPPLTEPTFCILAALAEPRHGYAIMQWAAEMTGDRVKLGPGTLYGALASLQERGLISPTGERKEGTDRRKVFLLSDQGRALLEAETQRLESIAQIGRKALGR
jgi:DNA-binding PadR family transcriptional regulator